MNSTTLVSTPRRPSHPSSMPIPPPRFHLMSGAVPIGWIDGLSIGFHGFAHEDEAAGAASIAYRTMTRGFARDLGRRPPPIHSEPLSVVRNGKTDLIVAGARPIARLLRPGVESPSGAEHFGFELQVPIPASEQTMRSTARRVYRALRRAGARWSVLARIGAPHPSTDGG